MTISHNKTKQKKRVTFQYNVDYILPEHTPTEDEKRRIWYNKEDYDEFKFNSAREAGVRLFDFFPPTPQGPNAQTAHPHKFVMIGSFDKEEEKLPSLNTDDTIASGMKPPPNRMKVAKSYHVPTKCTNEYKDGISKEGDAICKRGLGYHFSRYRKRNRVWTRSMVLTWQRTLRSVKLEEGRMQDQVQVQQQPPLKLSAKCDVRLNEKSQRLLALVSSKCSSSSRQAALWRGKMDYEMAHPGNRVSFDCVKANQVDTNKRAAYDYDNHAHRKRQRCENETATSGYTCKYLAGVLAVEI